MDPSNRTTWRDSISVQNLQLSPGVLAPDIWGQDKLQPALLSLRLDLASPGFTSAADTDALNESTVHYGKLSKGIREKYGEKASLGTDGGLHWSLVPDLVHEIVKEMAKMREGKGILSGLYVDLKLPKGSLMSEEGVVMTTNLTWEASGSSLARCWPSFRLEGVKVMVLVGVNANERAAKQLLVAGLTIDAAITFRSFPDCLDSGIFNIERVLVEILEATSFETLEALVGYTAQQLQRRLLSSIVPDGLLRLRLEKPRAIMFADAPAVEVVRHIQPRAA